MLEKFALRIKHLHSVLTSKSHIQTIAFGFSGKFSKYLKSAFYNKKTKIIGLATIFYQNILSFSDRSLQIEIEFDS